MYIRRCIYHQQECIPVGCVPSAAVTMSIRACTGQLVGGMCEGVVGVSDRHPPLADTPWADTPLGIPPLCRVLLDTH